jgi:hypothetical protein
MQEFGAGMVGCAQLEKEEVDIIDNSVVAGFKVIPQDRPVVGQLIVGLEGTCITGQRGECPKAHNCGRVKITTSVPPLFIGIEPLEVKNNQTF